MPQSILRLCAILYMALPLSAHAVQTKPPTATSYYVKSFVNDQDLYNAMYNLGVQKGQSDYALPGTQDSIVILDFGQPWSQSGLYGVWSFSPNAHFVSTSTITLAVEWFAYGYQVGLGYVKYSYLNIAVGTTNYGSGVTYAHGQAWAQMANGIGQWFSNNGYSQRTGVLAANDIEVGWSSPSTAFSWMFGYSSVFNYLLLNYGDASGCPTSGTTSAPRACSNGWTQDNVWYVAWGASPSYPLPEIYSTAGGNANQWQQLSLYSYLAHGGSMSILGPLTQSQACGQRPPCTGTNNTPDQGWSQMWTALNNDTRTAQGLWYSLDIKWQ